MASRFAFQKAWLSDTSAYPIIVIISGACVFCGTYFTRHMTCAPDIV